MNQQNQFITAQTNIIYDIENDAIHLISKVEELNDWEIVEVYEKDFNIVIWRCRMKKRAPLPDALCDSVSNRQEERMNKHISIDFEKMKTLLDIYNDFEKKEEEILQSIEYIESRLYDIKKHGGKLLYFKDNKERFSIMYEDKNGNEKEEVLLLWDRFV